MDQLKKLLTSLTLRQRISVVLAALLVSGGVLAFSHWKHESDFRPLYTGISAEEAGTVLQKLKESGTEYRLAENGAVLVPSARMAELRLLLAAAGLPKSGRIGFELFDRTAFGATEFVEHINYRRALEGELERSVMSLAEVEYARIHLSFPKDSVFLESERPAKASVMVRLKPGMRISALNVQAICNLVASAVDGLTPEAVSVVDMNGNLLNRPHRPGGPDAVGTGDDLLEMRQRLERSLVAKVDATLEPLLGADRFRAGASVDCDFSSGEESEETFDPAKSVMASSQKTEEGTTAGGASGVPGTASNLPRPTSRPGTAAAGLTRVTEDITYQTSRVTRHTRLPQGAIKRMSIAVLVDHTVNWEGQGSRKRRVLAPPTPETMKSIHDLVAAATGLDTERGDQLIVESLPFESTLHEEPPPPLPAPAKPAPLRPRDRVIAMGLGAGAIICLFLYLLVKSQKRRKPLQVKLKPALTAAEQGREVPAAEETVAVARPEELAALGQGDRAATEPAKPVEPKRLEDVVRELVIKDVTGSTKVLRMWLDESAG